MTKHKEKPDNDGHKEAPKASEKATLKVTARTSDQSIASQAGSKIGPASAAAGTAPDAHDAADHPPEDKDKTSEKGKKEPARAPDQLHYDPEDDVWALDTGKPSVGRKFAKSVMGAAQLILIVANYLGLFPLQVKRDSKSGTYSCKFQWHSHVTILFLVAGTFVVGSTLWLLVAIVCVSSNSPEHRKQWGRPPELLRSEEVYVIKRNTVNLVLICASFINTTICMGAVFLRRNFIAKQIVYWTEAVELLQLDVGRGVSKRVLRHVIVLIIFISAITALYVLNLCPLLAGSGSTLYILFNRPVRASSHRDDSMFIRKQIFAFFLLYVMVGGYVYILWFYYNCRILTNILKIWNNRFQYCLHRQIIEFMSAKGTQDSTDGARSNNRTSRAQLFQDHLVIFNLIEGVNTQFQFIIESFYLTTMILVVFEAYGIVHGLFYPEYCGSRKMDLIPTFLYLSLQLYMYIVVTLEAAGVADEARNVLHIVRRKGMMTAKLSNELWFMMSMRLSFGGHEDVGIIGAGFFYVTKSFLLGAVSAITSHFIIFYQFEVSFGQTEESDEHYAVLAASPATGGPSTTTWLIQHLEGVRYAAC